MELAWTGVDSGVDRRGFWRGPAWTGVDLAWTGVGWRGFGVDRRGLAWILAWTGVDWRGFGVDRRGLAWIKSYTARIPLWVPKLAYVALGARMASVRSKMASVPEWPLCAPKWLKMCANMGFGVPTLKSDHQVTILMSDPRSS